MEILGTKIDFFVKNRNFGQKSKIVNNRNFAQQSEFWSKIEILVKNRNFHQKIQIFIKKSKFSSKNPNFHQKIKIFIKKYEFWSKNSENKQKKFDWTPYFSAKNQSRFFIIPFVGDTKSFWIYHQSGLKYTQN